MSDADLAKSQGATEALSVLNKHINTIFDRAPVMMQSVDNQGRIVKVNRAWLRKFGYKRYKVLGRKTIDFLTEGSRVWAVSDTVPRFWQVGSSRSHGYQFVGKDGRVIDILLDADACPTATGGLANYAIFRLGHDLMQWEQSHATIEALQQLIRMRHNLESFVPRGSADNLVPYPRAAEQPPVYALEGAASREALGMLLEAAGDISTNLRGILRAQEEWIGTTAEQQRELLMIAKSIDRTLADLADSIATGRQAPE